MGRKRLRDIKNKFMIKSVRKYTFIKVKFVIGYASLNTNIPNITKPIIFKYETVFDIFSSLPVYILIK